METQGAGQEEAAGKLKRRTRRERREGGRGDLIQKLRRHLNVHTATHASAECMACSALTRALAGHRSQRQLHGTLLVAAAARGRAPAARAPSGCRPLL